MNTRHRASHAMRLNLLAFALAACMSAGVANAELPRRSAEQVRPSLPAIPEPAEGKVHGEAGDKKKPTEMSPEAQAAEVAHELFGPDPSYADKPYDVDAQLAIYGNKHAVPGPRPPIEWGYPMYQAGPVGNGITIFGDKNPARPQLLAYGDFRLGTGYNDNGKVDTAISRPRAGMPTRSSSTPARTPTTAWRCATRWPRCTHRSSRSTSRTSISARPSATPR